MKWAAPIALDQTYGYLCADGLHTTKHSEAMLFDSYEQAAAALEGDEYSLGPEEVRDEAEFRSRKDTW